MTSLASGGMFGGSSSSNSGEPPRYNARTSSLLAVGILVFSGLGIGLLASARTYTSVAFWVGVTSAIVMASAIGVRSYRLGRRRLSERELAAAAQVVQPIPSGKRLSWPVVVFLVLVIVLIAVSLKTVAFIAFASSLLGALAILVLLDNAFIHAIFSWNARDPRLRAVYTDTSQTAVTQQAISADQGPAQASASPATSQPRYNSLGQSVIWFGTVPPLFDPFIKHAQRGSAVVLVLSFMGLYLAGLVIWWFNDHASLNTEARARMSSGSPLGLSSGTPLRLGLPILVFAIELIADLLLGVSLIR